MSETGHAPLTPQVVAAFKESVIIEVKQRRVDIDAQLQNLKHLKNKLISHPATPLATEDRGEVYAQLTISIRDLESANMRLGLVLKNIGNPTPYPNSYNPSNAIVEPTADGLKY